MARMDMGDVSTAEITPNAATADILFELGMMYCLGRDVPKDYVTAHKWLNLTIRLSEFTPVGVRPLLIPAT